jgi:DNA-binding MarR family transcriptional regulator
MNSEVKDRELLLTLRDLAAFRYSLRKFLRFSEQAARAAGITPQQHQLMLGIAGFSQSGTATISELAEFLQEKHHSVIGLVERAEQGGFVERQQDPNDGRAVRVSLTPRGTKTLAGLTQLHKEEVSRVRSGMLRMQDSGRVNR